MMSSFLPEINFAGFSKIVEDTYEFFKTSDENAIYERLPYIKEKLDKMAGPLLSTFPPKKSIDEIALDWDKFFKIDSEIYSYGLEYGWLEDRMDVEKLLLYNHVPYHFRIGLYAHKGNFGIEEEFLIKDSFNILVKAQKSFDQLKKYGNFKQKML
ncbi:hypothetical protein J4Q03_14005 [Chryseobacterium sp. NFX27]